MAGANILVCEDEFIIAEDIRKCLENFGYKVSGIAGDAEEAISAAQKTKPDLALMDMRLRGELNGIQIADILRRKFDIPVIYLTAFSDPATLEEAKKTEPLGYLTKPFNDRELRSTIEMGLYRHKQQRELKQEIERSKAALQREKTKSTVAEQILNLQTELLRVKKMEAVRSLTRGVAHHVNNTLCVISGTLQYIQQYMIESGIMEDSQRNLVEAALQKSDRTAFMIKHLLWFSEQGSYPFEDVSLSKLMLETLEDVSPMMRKDIEISTHFAGEELPVSVDKRRVKQVITDLLLNAHDALSTRGNITVRTGIEFQELPGCFNEKAAVGWYAVAQISDNGSGMSEQVLERAFEPFFTTKDIGEAIGLGLSLAYGVMQSHGGWVKIESEEGRGTTVSLFFPLQRKATLNGGQKADGESSQVGQGEIIN